MIHIIALYAWLDKDNSLQGMLPVKNGKYELNLRMFNWHLPEMQPLKWRMPANCTKIPVCRPQHQNKHHWGLFLSRLFFQRVVKCSNWVAVDCKLQLISSSCLWGKTGSRLCAKCNDWDALLYHCIRTMNFHFLHTARTTLK